MPASRLLASAAPCAHAHAVTYEILNSEAIGGEEIKLVRKGIRFRVIGAPRRKLQAATASVRWEFRAPEVAWRAFEFAVATERFWHATFRRSRQTELREAMLTAATAFRAAAIRHGDPPGSDGVTAAAIAAVLRR